MQEIGEQPVLSLQLVQAMLHTTRVGKAEKERSERDEGGDLQTGSSPCRDPWWKREMGRNESLRVLDAGTELAFSCPAQARSI